VCGYCVTKIYLLQYPAAFQHIYAGTYIALSDCPRHTLLRPFHVTAGTAVLTAIFFFHIFVNIMLYTI